MICVYATLEALLLKGCKQEEHRSKLDIVKEIYIDDIHFSKLEIRVSNYSPCIQR